MSDTYDDMRMAWPMWETSDEEIERAIQQMMDRACAKTHWSWECWPLEEA